MVNKVAGLITARSCPGKPLSGVPADCGKRPPKAALDNQRLQPCKPAFREFMMMNSV
jgi:hypothetical protein